MAKPVNDYGGQNGPIESGSMAGFAGGVCAEYNERMSSPGEALGQCNARAVSREAASLGDQRTIEGLTVNGIIRSDGPLKKCGTG